VTDIARLVLDADTRGLKRGEQDLNSLAMTSDRAAGVVTSGFKRIGVAIAGAFAVSGGIGQIIQTNAEFGASMSKVAAISGATGDEFDKLREKALEMGAATQFSASQAADALGFLAMAGFSAAEAIEAIPDVLSLAAAAGMDLAEAADIASNVLSGFGKNAKDAGDVADVLAKAASVSNTNVSQLGQAMSTAAPIAAALGISMEETAAAIGVMSDAGIQGERAGTALRGVFASLAGPTTQAQEALAKYGLTAAQIDPQTVGLATAMATLRDANISTADAFVIFGREAASGALVMADTADRVRDLTGQFQNADGAAEAMAATMRDNLQGDIQSLKSAMEGLVIALGDSGVTGAFRSMAQFATEAIRMLGGNMGTLINVVASAVTGWIAYRTALLAAQGATLLMNSTLAFNLSVLASTRTALGTAAAAQTAFGIATSAAANATRGLTAALVANPYTAVAAAVGILASSFIGLANAQAQARAETNNLIMSLRAAASARSADFASQRAELRGRLREEQSRLDEIRRQQGTGLPTGIGAALLGRGDAGRNEALAAQSRTVSRLRLELQLADEAYSAAGKAAESMAIPTAQAATAVTGLGGSLKAAGLAANDTADEFGDLYERIFPESITRRQIADLALIEKYKDRFDDVFRARLRALGANDDATVSSGLLNEGPLDTSKVTGAIEDIRKSMEKNGAGIGRQTVTIAESFAQMSRQITGSLTGLANSLRSGDLLGILGGVLDIFTTLGSAGVFGSGLQGRLNAPPSFDGGGYTGSGSRSGGMDGKGGFLAMLHPNESVIDHTRGQRAPANDVNITVGIDPRSGNVLAFVDGRIAATGPVIANAGAQQAQAQMARSARRRVR
jgi:TP901 family phage tail tape measure protein